MAILWLAVLLIFSTRTARALNPTDFPNNKFGIHIQDMSDLYKAAELVNSNGGEWGYVTFVIRQDEMDPVKWFDMFNQLKELKLIPIVRIATSPTDKGWAKPDTKNIQKWADFLNELKWVTKNRYIIVFNEPNHAKEWGGEIDPANYADVFNQLNSTLKEKSENFFVLPAALDVSAKSQNDTMDAVEFWTEIFNSDADFFNKLDGWSSHSYPNPGFSGSATDTGRGTIKSYEWELATLKQFGLRGNIPVFITETGWAQSWSIDTGDISENYENAFTNIWTEPNLVTITPFILKYTQPPFKQFSWLESDGKVSTFFDKVKNLSKTKGKPLLALPSIDLAPLADLFPLKLLIQSAALANQIARQTLL